MPPEAIVVALFIGLVVLLVVVSRIRSDRLE
jgi:hypothetical protein